MITELDETLKQLLIREMPIQNNEVDIQFDLPKRDWATGVSKPTLNLYLYRIHENTELRRSDWVVETDGNGRATKKRPPRRMDLAYLVTAWTSTAEDEHRLLWRALWAFFRHPELPKEFLQGRLREATMPIPASIAQPDQIPNLADVWGVLDNELKPSLHLVVTLPLDLTQTMTSPLVLTKRIQVGQGLTGDGPFEEIIQIAGTVRDEEGQPLVGATVRVRESGFTAQTDEEGRYTFPNLGEGQYTFVVSAPEREARHHNITVLAREYDLDA
jgi:hypothetical protein